MGVEGSFWNITRHPFWQNERDSDPPKLQDVFSSEYMEVFCSIAQTRLGIFGDFWAET